MVSKRERASSRREEILHATVQLVEQVGYEGIRIADVAAKLGVSPSLVIYHFATKEELVARAFQFAMDNDLITLRRIARQEANPVDRVMAIMDWYAPNDTSMSWNLWINSWAAGMRNTRLRDTLVEANREWKTLLEDSIDEAVQGNMIAPIDSSAATVRMFAFVDGLAVARVARTAAIPRTVIQAWVSEMVHRELGIAHIS